MQYQGGSGESQPLNPVLLKLLQMLIKLSRHVTTPTEAPKGQKTNHSKNLSFHLPAHNI